MIGASSSQQDWDVVGLFRRAVEAFLENDTARVALARVLVQSVTDPGAVYAVRECIMVLNEKANGLQWTGPRLAALSKEPRRSTGG